MKGTALLIIPLLYGCATGNMAFVNVNKTPQEARQDALECAYEAEKATASIRSAMEQALMQKRLAERCAEVKGYVWQAVTPEFRQEHATRLKQ